MLDVCLLGTSGMMPLPGRWLTSLIAKFNGKGFLIDCGEGTQIAVREAGWSFHDIDVICFTHYHGDHISGLPGLLLSMGNAERTEPVILIGPKGLEKVVSSLRIIAPELPFEIKMIEIEGVTEKFELFGCEINAFKVNHNVTCYGYSLTIHRTGRFYAEKAKELGIPLNCWSKLQKGETVEADGKCFTPDMVLGPERKGIKVTYCTDTRPVDRIAEFAAKSDLFICEGMYAEADKQVKAVEHKHMMFAEAAKLAAKAEVGQMWLTSSASFVSLSSGTVMTPTLGSIVQKGKLAACALALDRQLNKVD
ncbi:MAG: ribonuclease Z, partial [Lachnospiraceae bacterium]|nr:ribonuclease Z [Lachnospiraceae bacterium]